MEAWPQAVLRQIILYSLPVLVSLSLIGGLESLSRSPGQRPRHAFYALAWKGAWLPLIASLLMQRAVIIALPRPIAGGVWPAAVRLFGHIFLAGLGWLLYVWALGHQAPAGLPPLHFWWAKVLMYFNLCMACLHLIPLPGMLAGEALQAAWPNNRLLVFLSCYPAIIFTALAASPWLDAWFGAYAIYPVYEYLASLATRL
ncbi:MAG: hypothetical protein R8K46_00865 [Mariprofundaceae bacterium]